MAYGLFIVPVVIDAFHERSPKYFSDGTVPDIWTGSVFVNQPWVLVCANLSDSDRTLLSSKSDVFSFSLNLDTQLTSQRAAELQTLLENIGLPSSWVNPSLTERSAARSILGMFKLYQKYMGLSGGASLFTDGITINSKLVDLTPSKRTKLESAATWLGLSLAGQTDNTLLRNFFKEMADQLQNEPYVFVGLTV